MTTSNQPRGAESFAAALAGGLSRRGLSVTLRALAEAQVGCVLPVVTLGRTPLGLPTLTRLRREIRRADLVVACGSTTLPASVIAGLATGRPIVYQNIGDPVYWANTPRRRMQVRFLLRRTAAVAAIADESADLLHHVFGVPRQRLQVVRNGRDPVALHPPSALETLRARALLSLPLETTVIAIVGALTPEKRVHVAISALGFLPGAQLLVVGDGPLRGALERHASAVAPGRVRFVGNRGDVRRVLHGVDALVLTSESEGVPGVLIEAGLCGLPVVATDVGFVSDVVVDDVTGRLVPHGEPQMVAEAVVEVIERHSEMGRAARDHCAARFDFERICDQWAGLIRGLLDMGARRA